MKKKNNKKTKTQPSHPSNHAPGNEAEEYLFALRWRGGDDGKTAVLMVDEKLRHVSNRLNHFHRHRRRGHHFLHAMKL